eukprot:3640544-Pyramimonas_sp.AAC.1
MAREAVARATAERGRERERANATVGSSKAQERKEKGGEFNFGFTEPINAHLPGVSWVAGGGAGPCEVRAEVRLEGGVAEAAGGGEAHVVVVGHAPPPVQGAGGGGVKGGVR